MAAEMNSGGCFFRASPPGQSWDATKAEGRKRMAESTIGKIVAYCGLECSECGAFKKLKCQGCHSDRPMFRSCPVKKCAVSRTYSTCAECGDFEDLKGCRKLNNIVSRLMGFVFRTNRIGNLHRIREIGLERFKAAD